MASGWHLSHRLLELKPKEAKTMNQEPMDHPKAEHEILTEDDFGDVADNNFCFLKIQKLIAACRIKEALEQLRRLQNHIKNSNEIQSQVYLLGRIQLQILSLEV
jgi:hypothetical protein